LLIPKDQRQKIGNTLGELVEKLNELFSKEFRESEITKRKKILEERYSNDKNAQQLIELVFSE